MSKIKAALITAILGTSATAMASPSVSWSADARFSFGTQRPAPVVRDHTRAPMPDYAMPSYAMPSTRPTSYITLASYLDLSSGRDVLRLDSVRASALTLRANMGRAYIEKVNVRFQDGSAQVIQLDQWMSTRSPAIEIALRGRSRIDAIIIVGEPSGRASYSVLARSEMMNRPPVFEQPAPILNVTGHYTSVFGDLYLTQHGNRVTGTYPGKQGTIEGTLHGNVLHFRWSQPGARIQDTAGLGAFYFDGRDHINGTWGTGNSATNAGEWDLQVPAQ